jgi:hypothetical protein
MTRGKELENIIRLMELKKITKVRKMSGVIACQDRIMITDVQQITLKMMRA